MVSKTSHISTISYVRSCLVVKFRTIHVGARRIVACYQYRPCVIYFHMKCFRCKRSAFVFIRQTSFISNLHSNAGWSLGCDKPLREKTPFVNFDTKHWYASVFLSLLACNQYPSLCSLTCHLCCLWVTKLLLFDGNLVASKILLNQNSLPYDFF